ncbi:MAG: hypothetical protein MI922_22425, partial [Bacteroidales bacterium]|nr:hypothetical protein [Bacteroidales bacterium]
EKGKYTSGLMDGVWKHYYINGELRYEGSYIQGNPDGKHVHLYADGTLKEEQFYNSGLKVKHWKKYNENGELVITISYKANKEYRINGQKVEMLDDNVIRIQ